MKKYDVAVIGSGPGGYVAAIRCAQLGMKTALIEKYDTLGGTCLNVGCIPSKTLLDSSEHFHNAAHSFADHGIEINTPKVNLPQMMKRKAQVVEQTCAGIDFLMKKNKIEHLKDCFQFIVVDTVEEITSYIKRHPDTSRFVFLKEDDDTAHTIGDIRKSNPSIEIIIFSLVVQ